MTETITLSQYLNSNQSTAYPAYINGLTVFECNTKSFAIACFSFPLSQHCF